MCKSKITIGILAVAVAMAACGSPDSGRADVHVSATEASLPVAKQSDYAGTIRESKSTDISFAVAGLVREMRVRKGDYVRKGDLLGTLDDAGLRSAYQQAVAAQKAAQAAYDKLAPSAPNKAEGEYALREAKSAVALAKKAWDDCRLYAPASGHVAEVLAAPGVAAAPGMAAVRIVEIDPVSVVIPVPESEIASVAHGQKGRVEVSGSGLAYMGTVVQRSVTPNPATGTCDVRLEVANPDGTLQPGMPCRVELQPANLLTGL